jgi:hypothetical protein
LVLRGSNLHLEPSDKTVGKRLTLIILLSSHNQLDYILSSILQIPCHQLLCPIAKSVMTLAQGFHFIKRTRILNVIFLEKQDLDIVVHFEA